MEKNGNVIAASFYGKLKTVTQIISIILLIIDMNYFGAFINTKLTGFALANNVLSTIVTLIAVFATIFSGIDYLKGCKELLKTQNNER